MRVARVDGLNRRATISDHKTSKAVHCFVDYPRPPKASQFMKPVAMIADAIRDVTKQGNPVLDPFCGSGTILIAAKKTGRWVPAIEIDCHYCDGAIRRRETVTGQAAVLAATAGTFEEVAERRAEA